MKTRIALKYCGGCNPGFDRVQYFKAIQNAAGNRIKWVSLDELDYETVLVIYGCEVECPVADVARITHGRIISVRDDKRDPGEIVQNLLSEGES